jgi:hypothetical protein
MYELRNFEVSSYNLLSSGKAVSVTYSEGVFISLVILHAMRMRHSFICVLSGYTTFFLIFS